jgi:peptide-methionine (S)-S-oxide reductase
MERVATFGAGCFWGVEAAFRRLDGVTKTRVGYAGGSVDRPSYRKVCWGRTGHAEVVEVTYDPEQVSYEQLLTVFWAEHDPTRGFGSQYRSVIFTHDAEQHATAERSREQVQNRLGKQVATSIEDAPTFWEAEDYHQQYLEKRGLASCTPRLAAVAA